MPVKEAMLKPITDKKAISSIKKALMKSSVDTKEIEKARQRLKSYSVERWYYEKYYKELALLLGQLVLFYGVPPLAGPAEAIGMVLLIAIATFVLAIIIGGLSNTRIPKWLYPFIVSLLFVPSVFLWYNESALIHALWYFVISFVGILIGGLMQSLRGPSKKK